MRQSIPMLRASGQQNYSPFSLCGRACGRGSGYADLSGNPRCECIDRGIRLPDHHPGGCCFLRASGIHHHITGGHHLFQLFLSASGQDIGDRGSRELGRSLHISYQLPYCQPAFGPGKAPHRRGQEPASRDGASVCLEPCHHVDGWQPTGRRPPRGGTGENLRNTCCWHL